MHDAATAARSSRGVLSRRQLIDAGVGDAAIRRLVRTGELHRLRTGWFSTPWADPLVVEAVRAGGVLTCLSALRMHGVWVPENTRRLHVRAGHRGVHLSGGCRLHGPIPPPTSAIDDVLSSVRHAATCLDAEGLVVICDSMLNSRSATSDELATALSHAPDRIRGLLTRCDAEAQSGTETMVRLRLRSRNIPVTTQFPIDGVGYVDLLVAKRLVVEVDSKAHHTGIERYESDRARDRILLGLGYLPMRLTYEQVVHGWSRCEQTIVDLVRRRDHRRRPRGVLD